MNVSAVPAPPPVVAADIPVKILLVDDLEENLTGLDAILQGRGYELLRARSGSEALWHLLREEVAVILLDVVMPDMDGLETAALIKQRPRSQHTPIIFLTAATDGHSLYHAYQLGAVDFLRKPLEPDVVRAKVAVFVELYRRGKQVEVQAQLLRESETRRQELELRQVRSDAEARYRRLADAIPQRVWRARPDGLVDYVNARWVGYTGLAEGQLFGDGWQAVVHPNDVARALLDWRQRLDHAVERRGECRLRHESGVFRWHLYEIVPERDGQGRLTGWLGTFTEIDEEKRLQQARAALLAAEQSARGEAEAALSRSEFLADASTVLASSLEEDDLLNGVVRLAAERLCTWCLVDVVQEDGSVRHAAFAHAAGDDALTSIAALGTATGDRGGGLRSRTDVLRVDDAHALADALGVADAALVEKLGVGPCAFVPLLGQDGVLGTMALVRADGRDFGPVDVALALDLARRATLGVSNARLYRQAQEAIAARDEFLSVASHELRTPLATVVLQVQSLVRLLESSGSDPVATRVLSGASRARRALDRLTRLVDELLDVTRIHCRKLVMQPEPFDLIELVNEVAERFEHDVKLAGCELHVDAQGTASGVWDRLRLEQVVTNLLQNALKFGRGGTIELAAGLDGDNAWFSVRDNGIGISPEDVTRIFGRFERAVSARSYGGIGLGLFIVDQIVRAHGGRILVESTPGAGACFRIELPRSALATVTDDALPQAAAVSPPA